MLETWVRSLGWKDPLEKGPATHSSILVWRVPMDRGARWATSMGLERIGQKPNLNCKEGMYGQDSNPLEGQGISQDSETIGVRD